MHKLSTGGRPGLWIEAPQRAAVAQAFDLRWRVSADEIQPRKNAEVQLARPLPRSFRVFRGSK
jgi:hypothetical protein